jgi:uncharacterized protein (DUF433 family)
VTWRERIAVNPHILLGKPVIKGTRIAVEFIIDLLSEGWSEDDILENYLGLTHDDIKASMIETDRIRMVPLFDIER